MEPEARPGRTVVVGVDDSEGSRRALEWVAHFLGDSDREVVAVHVLTHDHALLEDLTPDTMRNWRSELATRLRDEWVTPLGDLPHRCRSLEADSAAAGLLDAAEEEGAELIVVGAQGGSGLRHRILGGVTHAVTHRSPLPVVVVPADWHHAP